MYDIYISPASELYHHGIKGQKWGVRRYQNEDGSYTDAGKKRYGRSSENGKKEGFVKRIAGKIHKFRSDRATERLNDREEARARMQAKYDLDSKYAKNDRDKARAKAEYDNEKAYLDYRDAKDRAIINKKYKTDPEYVRAMQANGERLAKENLYGENGAVRYDTFINMGMTRQQAEARIFTEDLLSGLADAGIKKLVNTLDIDDPRETEDEKWSRERKEEWERDQRERQADIDRWEREREADIRRLERESGW